MHLLCLVEDSLAGRHVANIATDVARRMDARLTVVTADRARKKGAAATLRHDLLVIGPPPAWSLRERLPWGPRNRLIKRSRTPVMVVSDNSAVQRYDRIVLAHDRSQAGREAAARAAHLAGKLDATIHVVFPLARSERAGRPAKELARAVAQLEPALVVVGADPRPAWRRWHPAVAREVLRRGRHPVVLVQA
jgi:hypothetical protein